MYVNCNTYLIFKIINKIFYNIILNIIFNIEIIFIDLPWIL